MIYTETRVIQRTYTSLIKNVPYIIQQGGVSSGKTFGILYALLSYFMYYEKEAKVVSIVSQNYPHLRKGAIRDLETIIRERGLTDLIEHNRGSNFFKLPNGTILEYFSVDREDKALGAKRDFLFINECNAINYDIIFQLFIRTRKTVILDFNPKSTFWLHDKLLPSLNQKDYVFTRTTYKDNPALSEKERERIESIQDDYKRDVYVSGITGRLEGLIFDFSIVDEFPDDCEKIGYGLDFGFHPDPTALVRCGVKHGNLYIEELIYETELLNRDLAKRMTELGVSKGSKILCDHSPSSIQELKKVYGFYTMAAKKGKGSIIHGIQLMKNYNIKIIKNSVNLIAEMSEYVWETRNGKPTGKPSEGLDHCFVGDTEITTKDGIKQIKDIKAGDYVLTSAGYNKVLCKYNNGKRQVNLYKLQLDTIFVFIKCTDNHKIKTNEGWIEISKLKKGMSLYLTKNLTAKNITYTKAKGITQKVIKGFTESSGNTTTVKYQKGIISTILTETAQTIILAICSLSRIESIYVTRVKNGLEKIKNGLKNFTKAVLRPLKNGTSLRKDTSGTKNTRKSIILDTLNTKAKSAKFAKRYTPLKRKAKNSALITAKQSIDVTIKSITKKDNVYYAKRSLNAGNTQNKNYVHQAVLQSIEVIESDVCEVYDFMVENEHEYFANGVLVHNCIDASRYYASTYLVRRAKTRTATI